jgi:hypothetical protein
MNYFPTISFKLIYILSTGSMLQTTNECEAHSEIKYRFALRRIE